MKKLNINDCIIRSNIQRINAKPPIKSINSMQSLAELVAKEPEYTGMSVNSVYFRMYRSSVIGVKTVPEELTQVLLRVLNDGFENEVVTYENLVGS